jgi:hypothetical protein
MKIRVAVLVALLGVVRLDAGLSAAPPKEEPVPWQVEPDPLPWKIEKSIPADKSISLAPNRSVIYPTSQSPFVGIVTPGGKDKPSELKVYDLRTMDAVGNAVQVPDAGGMNLSPWGDLWVRVDNKAALPTVQVWSAKGEDVKASAQIWEEKVKIEALDFAGPGQFLTVKEIREGKTPKRLWEVWDAKTGTIAASFHYQLEYHPKWIGWTPGRRYLIMQETATRSYHLLFWDLKTGKLAGKIQQQDGKDPWGQCGHISVSPDGKEAALIWRLFKDGVLARIMRYDLVKGTKIGDLDLRDEILPSDPGFLVGGMRTFQFLPDGRGWLVSGCQIVEREKGGIVWEITPRPRYAGAVVNRRFVDGYHVTKEADKKLQLITLPKGELDIAFNKARKEK